MKMSRGAGKGISAVITYYTCIKLAANTYFWTTCFYKNKLFFKTHYFHKNINTKKNVVSILYNIAETEKNNLETNNLHIGTNPVFIITLV